MRRFMMIAALLLATTSMAIAQPPFTRRSSQVALDNLKQTASVPNFRIGGTYDLDHPDKWESGGEGGVTLESLGAAPAHIGYIAVGTPKRDSDGDIVNAIVINSYYSGDSTDMYQQWVTGTGLSGGPMIGPGRVLDTNRYYVVMCDALGLWGGSKPSEGLGQKFPQYSYQDMVQTTYRVLRDTLKVKHASIITGVSMGGTQTYVWGVMHPDFMDGIMPICGTTQSDAEDPVGNWTFQLMTAAIESDPVWKATGGDYYDLPKDKHPNQGVAFGWSVLSLTGFDFAYHSTQDWKSVQPDVFYWQPPNDKAGSSVTARAQLFDAVDLIYRNRAGETYNINKDLGRIQSRALVMHIKNDQWLNYKLAERAVDLVPGAELLSEESPVAHYGVFSILKHMETDPKLVTFMNDMGRLETTRKLFVTDMRRPGVAADIDPAKSFWLGAVTYPFPVKFATAKDKAGNPWQIGYMDEYAGKDRNPPVLVIIHGKGAFGGHYGNVMKIALERGFRVIVPDLPHYGMSGPGNLEKSPARTMQDMRETIHNLIVDQLGVAKAAYMGHSLGGQFVMGYALTWPDAVSSLVLEAPAGLEEYPRTFQMGDKTLDLFHPAFARDFPAWRATWDQTGILKNEMARTEQGVRDFFYFKRRDPVTGEAEQATSGYFMNDSEYARLHAEQRVGLIKGNPKELEQWANVFIFDVYSMVSELQRDDPNNLYQRLIQLKQPIFLAFGEKEPFIPGTAFNGLKNLGNDVITPFMSRMAFAGNRPVLKIYPGAAHFIHTDAPVEFPLDVVDFVSGVPVEAISPLAVDVLMNGAPPVHTVAAASGGPSPTAGLNKERAMARIKAGDVTLGWRAWGEGDITVVFIQGNLASKDWLELSARHLPSALRVVGIDWRGCGESDRPAAEPGYTNYTMQQHAEDMLAALDALGIARCHLATHSTGGIIAARMLLAQPERFGRVLALDPVTPIGLQFDANAIGLFRAMMASRDLCRTVMATAAASLFVPASLASGQMPAFAEGVSRSRDLFEKIVEQAYSVAEGVWIGTPHNLNLEFGSATLVPRMGEIANEHLVIWGKKDGWIPRAHLERMAAAMPRCRLLTVPGVGHSMNVELPALYAGYLGGFLGGVQA
jgi:homoserine O-acetyltransferase